MQREIHQFAQHPRQHHKGGDRHNRKSRNGGDGVLLNRGHYLGNIDQQAYDGSDRQNRRSQQQCGHQSFASHLDNHFSGHKEIQ